MRRAVKRAAVRADRGPGVLVGALTAVFVIAAIASTVGGRPAQDPDPTTGKPPAQEQAQPAAQEEKPVPAPEQPAAKPAIQLPPKPIPWGGDRTMPVHLIPLRDERNELIVPTETNPMPFSARFTCGPCHDYDTVRGGWHFNAGRTEKNGRPGQPWVWVDEKTGTWLPLTSRNWPGSWNPAVLGLTPWDMTLLFGRHMPGSGPGEPPGEDAGPGSRWNVSGFVEANCLACHSASPRQDHSEWAKQVLRQNFRWAATAASGLGEVGGIASRLRETWDVYDGPNPDDQEWAVAPFVKYRRPEFDSKHRVFFDLTQRGDEQRCLTCHAVAPAGAVKHETDRDVHTAAGLKCADCHRNGLDHAVNRGYEGEAAESGQRAAASFTCRGCHLGEDLDGKQVLPGRAGAPRPAHKGFPLVHFKRLACTVCHSGTVPAERPTRVRTARANRLAIHGVAQWWTEAPAIFQPVFARDRNVLLTPHRMLWPAAWVRLEGREVVPIRPDEVEAAAGEVLKSEERAAAVLNTLVVALEENETPAFIAGGFVFEVNIDGRLDATEETPVTSQKELATPLRWAVRRNGEVAPLVADFDPAAEDKDPNAEARIQRVLEALAQFPGRLGDPAVVVRQTLYKMTEGVLEMTEAAPELAGGVKVGWLRESRIEPLVNDFDVRTLFSKAGREETLTEEQVAVVLKTLAEKSVADQAGGASAETAFGYMSGGRLFRLAGNGRLTSRRHAAAEPTVWPLAHDVRPAQQSLGRNGCRDCHSGGSDFFFGRVQGAGPLLTGKVEHRGANRFMELGRPLQWFFGLSFTARPLLKILLAVCGLVISALLLLSLMYFISRWSGMVEKR